jgi:tripartite-type tricarboxylate transporter receptor subunit TctC
MEETMTRGPRTIRLLRGLFAAACTLAGAAAFAGAATAADYPTRPVRIVVPWPAGGPTDAVARVLAEEMSATLGQPFIIDNKAGATGSIGSDNVAKSAPDGYTIVVANTASHSLGKVANAKLPYDPVTDFKSIIEYGNYPVAIMGATSLPAKNLKDFIAYSKTQKDGLSIGVPGSGSVSHIYGLLLAQKTGAKLVFVPYRGDAPARLDLLAGNIQGVASTPDFELIAAGKAWLVGSTGAKRWKQTANVPTFAEEGYPDLIANIAWGFSAPANTPDDIIKTLNDAANKALKSEKVLKIMEDNSYFPVGGPPSVLTNDFNKQIAEFSEMFKSGLVKLDQ